MTITGSSSANRLPQGSDLGGDSRIWADMLSKKWLSHEGGVNG